MYLFLFSFLHLFFVFELILLRSSEVHPVETGEQIARASGCTALLGTVVPDIQAAAFRLSGVIESNDV